MKLNRAGVVEAAVLYVIIGVMALLFVPNPISSATGIGVRPNKTVLKDTYKETVELLRDKEGNIIGQKTVAKQAVSDVDQQERVSLLEQIRHLPSLLIALVVLGFFCPPVGAVLAWLWARAKGAYKDIRGETQTIVKAMDKAFATIPLTISGYNLPGEVNRAGLAKEIEAKMKEQLGDLYDQSTKDLVKELR